MSSISERIDGIITARKKRLALVASALERAQKSDEIVKSFKEARDNLDLEKAGMTQDDIERINNISFLEYDNALATATKELERLKKRFEREKINISFVGRAGQGKSLVLQKISGLGGTVIPSASGSDCTGAKSIITNDETAVKPYASITFFSEAEMVKIFNVYLEKIFGNSSKNISSLNKARDLNRVLNQSRIPDNKKPTVLELRKYIDHLDEIRTLLGRSECKVEEESIEEYVAMYKSDDRNIKYYKYLGVKCADIHCAFPKRDAGKIILVDTIGMGSQSLGVGDSLMDTVKNDSDAVIYMKRPEAKRDRWGTEDSEITNGIVETLGEESARMTMFCVLNLVTEGDACNKDNLVIVRDYIKKYYNESYFADVLTVDCSNEAEVENKLLTPVLETISRSIDEIDEIYLKDASDMMSRLHLAFHDICGLLVKVKVKDTFARYSHRLIKKTIQNGLQNEVRKLYLKKQEQADEKSEAMMEEVEQILKGLPSTILAEQDIINYILNNNIPIDAYKHAMNVMRVRIIKAFLSLDSVLAKETNRAKEEIIRILTDPNQGALGNAFPYQDGDDPSAWINGFIEKNHGEEGFSLLEPAFQALLRYSLKVEGFMMHEIRLSLTPIDPILQGTLNELPIYKPGAEDEIAECIIDYLKDTLFELRQTIRKKIAKYETIVNQANFAAIWDFHDRISYPESGDDDAVIEAWEALYERWCNEIWPDEAIAYNETRDAAVQWNNAIEQLKGYDEDRNFSMR